MYIKKIGGSDDNCKNLLVIIKIIVKEQKNFVKSVNCFSHQLFSQKAPS